MKVGFVPFSFSATEDKQKTLLKKIIISTRIQRSFLFKLIYKSTPPNVVYSSFLSFDGAKLQKNEVRWLNVYLITLNRHINRKGEPAWIPLYIQLII